MNVSLQSQFYGDLEDHPLSAVRDCLFSISTATLHVWRPLLHPEPEDAPFLGDEDSLIMDGGFNVF